MGLLARLRTGRRTTLPIVAGVVALLLGVSLTGWIAVAGTGDETSTGASTKPGAPTGSRQPREQPPPERSEASGVPDVKTKPVRLREAGFLLAIPVGFKVEREDGSARFVSPGSDLVVTAGSGAPGPPKAASRQLLASIRESYTDVTVNGRQDQRIAGHRAIVTSGQSTNSAGVDIRFLAVVLRGQGQNYTIAAYTAVGADPEQVLPKVNAVVNSFEVTPRD